MEPLHLVVTLYVGLVAMTALAILTIRRSRIPESGKGISIWVIVYNGIALALTIPFFLHTGSASIRPMGWSLVMCAVTIIGLVSLFRTCLRIETTEFRWVSFFAIPFVAATPFISAGFLIQRAGDYAGFVLSD